MKRRRMRPALHSEEALDLRWDLYLFDEVRDGIFQYISERYLGAFLVEEGLSLSGYVCVCKEALCYFIRTLLNDIFGRSVLRITYGQRIDKMFYLRFTYDKSVPISTDEKYKLLVYAKRSKARLEYAEEDDDAVITLAFPYQSALFERVYATSPFNQFFLSMCDIVLKKEEDRESVNDGRNLLNSKPRFKP